MPKIQFTNRQHIITIPKEVMQIKGWKKGQILYFALNNRTMEVSLITDLERTNQKKD